MAVLKGQNSYATTAEADTYFEHRLDAAAWQTATPEEKAAALVTATSLIDAMVWAGAAASADQPLAFPRVGSYFDPFVGTQVQFTDSPPNRLIRGLFEMAYHMLNNDGLLDESGSISELTVGPITLRGLKQTSGSSTVANSLLSPMLAASAGKQPGSSTWFRAN